MGRNFTSVCHDCKVELMHLRGEESRTLHSFSSDHCGHKTELFDDYCGPEPPEGYKDLFDEYNPDLIETAPKEIKE